LTRERATSANSTYKKLAVQWLNKHLCFVASSVLADSFRLRNRQLLVAANRWLQLEEKREETKRSSIVVRAKMQRHEKEERDRKQAATNNMYSLCNELF
jgi:hypothetical protein